MTRCIPLLFAMLWSTGFIGAKFGLPYIGPYKFLFIRFALTLGILATIAFFMRTAIPKDWRSWRDICISGVLVHVVYLGGVFTAINIGLPAGVTAIMVGMQPVITLLVTGTARDIKVLSISILGFLGLILVVWDDGLSVPLGMLFPAALATVGITFGTVYQKKTLGHLPILSIVLMQYIPTVLIFGLFTVAFEAGEAIRWSWQLGFALAWLCLVLSIGAMLLMSVLYRDNSASTAANYFYAAPPLALIQSYAFFGEEISTVNFAGIFLVVASLYLVRFTTKPISQSVSE